MRFGSLFSGVGGFDLGLELAGWECAWQVEIDDQCRAVLRRHWPDVTRYEDVQDVRGSDLAPVDLICGGFPCQDLSVAGRREGLAGERSGLWYEFHRIIGEAAPRWVLIENVPGLLSSNEGRDLSALLGGLADLGYWWTYRVLDSQYFGVPQRRRRVFIVGHSGGPCPPEVLLEPEGLPWNPAPRREKGEGFTHPVSGSLAASGRGTARVGESRGQDPIVASETGKGWWTEGPARLRGQPGGMPQNIVAGQCHGTNVGEMGALRAGNGNVTGGVPFVAKPLDTNCGDYSRTDSDPAILPFDTTQITSKYRCGSCGEVFTDRHADEVGGMVPPECVRCGEERDIHPLAKGAHPPSVAYSLGSHAGAADGETSNKSHQKGGPVGMGIEREMSPGLRSARTQAIIHAVPRRLTPVEAERLQGLPDGWTAWGVDEDGERVEMADTPRYRMLGNAVTMPVAAWIGRRILELS